MKWKQITNIEIYSVASNGNYTFLDGKKGILKGEYFWGASGTTADEGDRIIVYLSENVMTKIHVFFSPFQ